MTLTADRAAAVEAFYRRHHRHLERRVAGRVAGASRPLIEDACQNAWTRLVRRPDIRLDHDGLAWLTLAVIQELWRTVNARDVPTGAYALGDECDAHIEPPDPLRPTVDELVIDRELHHRRRLQLGEIKSAEREALVLKALGSYTEIAAVNRRLTEGRARLRAADNGPAPTLGDGGGGEL